MAAEQKCDYCGGWNTVGCGTCQQRRMREEPSQAAPIDNGGFAFPFTEPPVGQVHPGMYLRDYFAGLAMQAFLTGHITYHGHESHWPYDQMASEAFDVADAMLKARES